VGVCHKYVGHYSGSFSLFGYYIPGRHQTTGFSGGLGSSRDQKAIVSLGRFFSRCSVATAVGSLTREKIVIKIFKKIEKFANGKKDNILKITRGVFQK